MKPDIPNLIKCTCAFNNAQITVDGSSVESYLRENDEVTIVNFSSGKTVSVYDEIGSNRLVCCDLDDCIAGKYKLEGRPVISDPNYSNLVEGTTPEGKKFCFDGFALEGYSKKEGENGFVELYFQSGNTVRVVDDFESGEYYDCRAEDILPQCLTEKYRKRRPSEDGDGTEKKFNTFTARDILGFDTVCFDAFSISSYMPVKTDNRFCIEVTFNSGRIIEFPCDGPVYDEWPELENLLDRIVDGKYRSYWKKYPTVINKTGLPYIEKLMEGVFRLTPEYQLENIGRTAIVTGAGPEEINVIPEEQADQCSYVLKIAGEKDGIVSWTFHEVFHHDGEDTVQEICDGRTDRNTGENIPCYDLEVDGFRMFNRTDCGWARGIMKDVFKYGLLSEEEKGLMGDSLTVFDYDLDNILLTRNPDTNEIKEDYSIRTWNMFEDGGIEWTLFRMEDDEDGLSYGEAICNGMSYFCPSVSPSDEDSQPFKS